MNYKEYKTKSLFEYGVDLNVLLDIDNIFSVIKTMVMNYGYYNTITDGIIINPITGGGLTVIEGSKDEIDTIYKELSEYLLVKNNKRADIEKIFNQLKPKQPANINE